MLRPDSDFRIDPNAGDAEIPQVDLYHFSGERVAMIEVWGNRSPEDFQFLGINWTTLVQPKVLLRLIEKTLAEYEATYPAGLRTLNGGVDSWDDRKLAAAPNSMREQMVAVYGESWPNLVTLLSYLLDTARHRVRRESREEIVQIVESYTRPLRWSNVPKAADRSREFRGLSVNTPIADFMYRDEQSMQTGDPDNIAVLTNLRDLGIMAEYFHKTRPDVSEQKALEFFEAAVAQVKVR